MEQLSVASFPDGVNEFNPSRLSCYTIQSSDIARKEKLFLYVYDVSLTAYSLSRLPVRPPVNN